MTLWIILYLVIGFILACISTRAIKYDILAYKNRRILIGSLFFLLVLFFWPLVTIFAIFTHLINFLVYS